MPSRGTTDSRVRFGTRDDRSTRFFVTFFERLGKALLCRNPILPTEAERLTLSLGVLSWTQEACNYLQRLVAGARFELATFGL